MRTRRYILKQVVRVNRMHHRLATGKKRGDGNESGFKVTVSACFIDAEWTATERLKLPY